MKEKTLEDKKDSGGKRIRENSGKLMRGTGKLFQY